MRRRRKWLEINCPPRPLCFAGFPSDVERPATFKWEPMDFDAPKVARKARLYYRVGWSALLFWTGEIFFAEEILSFDALLELLRSRFDNSNLQMAITRDFIDE